MVDESFDLGIVAVFEHDLTFTRDEPAYPLSDSERALIDAAPFRHTHDGWKRVAWIFNDCVLHGYRKGEMDFKRMMEVVRACSLGCAEDDRVEVLALTADRALRLTPRSLNSSPPPYPPWQRKAAVDLVLYLESQNPHFSNRQNRQAALAWLTSLGLATENTSRRHPLSERTLERWVHEHRKAEGSSRPAGRPAR
jgi:hypothetical protein